MNNMRNAQCTENNALNNALSKAECPMQTLAMPNALNTALNNA